MNFLSKLEFSEINKKQNYIILTIILLSWSHQWLSIGSFINIAYNDFSLSSILAYRNQSLSIFVINIFILIFNKKKNTGNRIYFYFFLIPISYLLGLINLSIDTPSEKNIGFFYHLTFVLQMINTLLILNNLSKITGVDEAILLKVNLLLIFIYVTINLISYNFDTFKFNTNINFLHFKIATNVNGISRILCMLNIFIICHYFVKKEKENHLFLLFIIIIINFFIINTESRQGFVLTTIQLIVIIFFCCKKNEYIKKIIKYFFLLIIIPLSLSFFLKKDLAYNRILMFQGDMKTNTVIKDSAPIQLKLVSIDKFTTGRFSKWIRASTHIINSKIKNILFGNGQEFDRKIEAARGAGDVANGMLYVLLCGGMLGLFSLFILMKKFLRIIIYTFYNKKKFNTDVYFCFSIVCIISLTLRTFIENGFLAYGVDFLIITSSIFYVIKKLKLI
jgi:hypothetical protein